MLNLEHSPLYWHFCKCPYIELLKFRLFFNYWHIANPIYFMIFGCTRHSSNKFGSALVCTKIRSCRMLKKSQRPLNILDKVFTLKNSNKFDSIRLIRLLVKNLPRYSHADRPCIFIVLMIL